jgi:hypothetical protein
MTSYTLATHEQRAKRQEYLEAKKAEEAKVVRQKEEQINFLESCLDRFNLNYDAKKLLKDEIEKFNKKTQIENQKESERWEKEQIVREERRKENIKETIKEGVSATLIFILKIVIIFPLMGVFLWYVLGAIFDK